jgi:hypothetical protein
MHGLRAGKLFPETIGFMIAVKDQVISTNNYKDYVVKDPNVTNNMYRKCSGELETIQHTASKCHAPVQGNYTHLHNQAANIIHQELTIKCGQLQGPPISYCKYEPKSVLGTSSLNNTITDPY